MGVSLRGCGVVTSNHHVDEEMRAMGHEPGDSAVSEEPRAFEQQDEQVEPGPDREREPDEEAAADRAGPVEEHTRQAYEEMAKRGAAQEGEGRI
jgi:hypothetical protein